MFIHSVTAPAFAGYYFNLELVNQESFFMKKSVIASIVALGFVSGLAQAAVPTNEIQFHGTVTATTCDIEAFADGSLSPSGANRIELGDVAVGGTGKTVTFSFKPVQNQQNITACDAIAAGNKTPELTWTGIKFNGQGLGMLVGTATDAHVKITPVNDKGQNKTFINATNTKHTFDAGVLSSTNNAGLKYSALLEAGQTPGDFQTAANFNLTYK